MASIAASQPVDYFSRWHPFWVGITDSIGEHFIGVDNRASWGCHVVMAKETGKHLRAGLMQRFTSTTIFLSVILATEIGVMTSPAKPADQVRVAMGDARYGSLEFWTGVALCMGILLSISALIANYSAWAIFAAVGEENLTMIARSSLGLYAHTLPKRLITSVVYLFLLWICLFWYILMPLAASVILSLSGAIVLVYIISSFSALGNLIMHSGVLSESRIVSRTIEEELSPAQLSEELLRRKVARQDKDTTMRSLYRQQAEVQGGGSSTHSSISETSTIDCGLHTHEEEP